VNLIDLVILVILVLSIVTSAIKGFVRVVFGLITVLIAILLASWLYRPASGLFKDVVRTEILLYSWASP